MDVSTIAIVVRCRGWYVAYVMYVRDPYHIRMACPVTI